MKLIRYLIVLFLICSFGIANATTRALQFECLRTPLIDYRSQSIGSGYTVYFYSSGTSTAKNAWTDADQTTPITSATIGSDGTVTAFGEGVYKVVVKDADGTTVYTWDPILVEYPYYGIRTVIATGSQQTYDDFLLVNTTSASVTINALAAANWKRPLKIQRIAGSNSIIFDPDGSETIDGSAILTWSSDSIVEIISDGSNLRSAGFRSSFADADNDTKIQVEESADEDKIRLDTGGTERVVVDSNGLDIKSGGLLVGGNSAIDSSRSATLTGLNLNAGAVTLDAILDEDDMASNSSTAATTQQSQVSYITSGAITFSNKNFSQSGTVAFTDTGSTTAEYPVDILTPNLSDAGSCFVRIGKELTVKNIGSIKYVHTTDDSNANEIRMQIEGTVGLRLNAVGNLGINAVPAASGGARVSIGGTAGITDTLTLSKATGTGLSVASNVVITGTIDFGSITSGATKSEINAAADGMGVTIPRQKIIEIGDWNMDGTASVNVAHGLTVSKIVGFRVMIRNDAGDTLHQIPRGNYSTDDLETDAVIDGVNVELGRETGGYYDDPAYDATSFNRGWIIIDYID